MDDTVQVAASAGRDRPGSQRRLKRHAAVLAARCAMGSWLLLAAMPIVVVVCALA